MSFPVNIPKELHHALNFKTPSNLHIKQVSRCDAKLSVRQAENSPSESLLQDILFLRENQPKPPNIL
jgi:hypothetical protein